MEVAMRDFGRWMREQKPAEIVEELPDGLWRNPKGVLTYYCRSCGNASEWYGETKDFDIDNENNLCGGSPCCCP